MFNGTPVWSQLVVGVGDPAPEIVAPDQDDVTFTLSDEMGKVVLLHVCTLWCVPCVQSAINEATLVASIDSEIGAENWVLVDALYHNLGFGPSSVVDANSWRDNFGTPARTIHCNGVYSPGLYETIFTDYGVISFPTYFVISP